MKNPADSRKYYFYTPHEYRCALDIYTAAKQNPVNAARLYPASWITWAFKVIKWFSAFTQVLRRYAKIMKGAAIAVKTIWHNLKQGISIMKMLKLATHKEQEQRTAPKEWYYAAFSREHIARHGNPIQFFTEKRSHKTERRAQIVQQTNSLQLSGQF